MFGSLLLTSACAGARPGWQAAPFALDAALTRQDQSPYAPKAQPRGQSGDRVALSMEGGETQARAAALALVQALIDSDATKLRELLAERIVYVTEGIARPGSEVITRCLQETRSLAYEPSLSADSVVDIPAIEVHPARARFEELALPSGIAGDDLVVSLHPKLSPEGARRVSCLGTLYVHPGPHPLIVGFAR